MTNWTSLLAADGAAFNSGFHRDAFFDALPGLLGAAPDQRHLHLVDQARTRCAVVPVGVDLQRIGPRRERSGPATFLWNHRWDADKAPEEALAALGELARRRLDFRVVLAGNHSSNRRRLIARRSRRWGTGWCSSVSWTTTPTWAVLHSADAVVSTAHQEFFGISVVEAMYAGALPILPNRLVYPERVPPGLEGMCLYRTPGQLIDRLGAVAADPSAAREAAPAVCLSVEQYDWAVVGPQTDAWMESVGTTARR